MKKLFLVFILLTPVVMASYGGRAEIIVSPTYVNQKKENGFKVGKYALGSGVKISTETISSFGDGSNAVIGAGVGVSYNSLKVKGNGIKSDSGNLVSVPLYLIFGTGTDNGIYTKLSAGFAVRNGSVKWTDNNGVRKERFSIGVSASTSTKAKRTYSSSTKHYRDNIMLSGAAISLDFGYALKYE